MTHSGSPTITKSDAQKTDTHNKSPGGKIAHSEELSSLIEFALEGAAEEVLSNQAPPRTFYTRDNKGKINIVVAPVAFGADDYKVTDELKIMFLALDVTEYAIVAEVWQSKDPHYHGGIGSELRPENDPNRMEALSAFAVRRTVLESGNAKTEIRSASRTITRNPTAVGPLEIQEASAFKGRLVSLLPPDNASAEIIEKMRALIKETVGKKFLKDNATKDDITIIEM